MWSIFTEFAVVERSSSWFAPRHFSSDKSGRVDCTLFCFVFFQWQRQRLPGCHFILSFLTIGQHDAKVRNYEHSWPPWACNTEINAITNVARMVMRTLPDRAIVIRLIFVTSYSSAGEFRRKIDCETRVVSRLISLTSDLDLVSILI